MPAFSFKARFCEYVKDGSKPGTIRGVRNHAPRAGQLAHLFYAMRTKQCTKLVEPSPVILSVRGIYISENIDVALFSMPVTKHNEADLLSEFVKIDSNKLPPHLYGMPLRWLTADEKDQLAWTDGFREAGQVRGSMAHMIPFWMTPENRLPFLGNYIMWGEGKI